ncbi:MAG: porin family protein [Sulfurimonas sp.]|nr:porin family protein [Sulfurimonas sp.]
MVIETGSANLAVKASAAGAIASGSDSGGYISVKGGKYFDNSRVSASYSFYNTDSNVDMSAFAVGYDYMFNTSSKFTPFIGVNVGYSMYEETSATIPTIDVDGMTYGAGIGVMYEINKNFEIEFNAKYNKSIADDTVTVSGVNIKVEADYITHIGIGINYNF